MPSIWSMPRRRARRPGRSRRFDAATGPLPSGLKEVSSHGFGLAQAIELARALLVLPRHCVVHAIEGERFDPGASLTPAVAPAAATVAERILIELAPPAEGVGEDTCTKRP